MTEKRPLKMLLVGDSTTDEHLLLRELRAQPVRDYGKIPRVEGSEARLGRVFLNLVINAAHAIPEGNSEGNRITVRTRVDESGQVVEPAAPRRKRIPFIDDEPTIQRVVRRALAPEHDAVVLSAAHEALARLLEGDQFDISLCDLMMLQMTGIDLYRELGRALPAQAERIIFLTGAFKPQARAFLDEIPNLSIEKPFKLEHLRAMVNERLQKESQAPARQPPSEPPAHGRNLGLG